jgi:hypothetical protein
MRWYEQLVRMTVWKEGILLGGLGDMTYQAGFRKKFGEVELPSKWRATGAANHLPQNSSNEPTPKAIQITGSLENFNIWWIA